MGSASSRQTRQAYILSTLNSSEQNMRTTVAALAIVLLLFAPRIPSASAQKSEEGLLVAWEQAQKADPNTLKFERVKDHQYHFATKRFPFDGDLLVRNGVVEDFSVYQDGISMGTVEAELQGLTDNFYRTYARSYPSGTPQTLCTGIRGLGSG